MVKSRQNKDHHHQQAKDESRRDRIKVAKM